MRVFGGSGLYATAALGLLVGISLAASRNLYGSRDKADPNDATARLFQLLDNDNGGKLDDLYILADSYTDSSGEQYRHVLRLHYDKSRAFGRLALYVRAVGKMTPEQLSTYTPEQDYDFAESDLEKFVKTDPGPFGQRGDLYLQGSGTAPLHTSAVTGDARKSYETYVTQFLIPALEKSH